MKNYKVMFNIEGLGSRYNGIEGLADCMGEELIRVHNLFADKTNSGITDKLNEEFESLYPSYFKDNMDKDYDDLIEYNRFMDDGYQRLVLDDMNEALISPILYFKTESGSLVGYMRGDKEVKIGFYLVEAD